MWQRLFAYSKSCKPFKEVTSQVKALGPFDVHDSLADHSYSIQLNVASFNGIMFQNVIQVIHNRQVGTGALTLLWNCEAWKDSLMLEQIPGQTLPLGIADPFSNAGYLLGMTTDPETQQILAVLAMQDANGTVKWQNTLPFSTKYYDVFTNVEVGLYGAGNSSNATFTNANFDIETFTDMNDLTYDGVDWTIKKYAAPDICKRPYGQTLEGSNMVYEVYTTSNDAIMTKCHPL